MNFKTKLLAVAVLPVALISIASFWVIQAQTEQLAQTQIQEMEARTLKERRAELQKMNKLAISSLRGLYQDSSLPEPIAKERAKQRLHDMAFGEDGYFFVYDQTGTNLVHPRLPELVGKNWWGLQDPNGDYVIQNLIRVAKAGGGFHTYVWNKPSTGKLSRKIGHAVYLEKWNWMIGTGLYIDDVEAEVAAMRETLGGSINRTKQVVLSFSIAGVLLAGLFTWAIRLSEQRFADKRLKELTHRIVEVQEDERKRVSGELHDGISQLLVSARYGLDQAMGESGKQVNANRAVHKSARAIENAIAEVRRISMALRPSVLDDIGLAAALKSLGRDFGDQTGLHVSVAAQRTSKLLSSKPRTALYRVAQEALTNVAKHSNAKNVWISLKLSDHSITLRIEDDGSIDLKPDSHTLPKGMGLRNMRERMDAFSGSLEIEASQSGGLCVTAKLPLEINEMPTQGLPTPEAPSIA